jgi:serine/threonine protein kinase
VQVLANVALRLAEFHSAGYVHRDLKPANVMWLPRENRWTVIDFGCAARTGTEAPLSFTLVYAAPEVINAVRADSRTIKAAPALDTWALGVMAFELLSGEPAFHVLSDGKEEVRTPLLLACTLCAHSRNYLCALLDAGRCPSCSFPVLSAPVSRQSDSQCACSRT